MKNLFETPTAIAQARESKKGLNVVLECLVFIAVYFVGTFAQGILTGPVSAIMMFKNKAYTTAIASGDMEKILAVTQELASSNFFMILSLFSNIVLILIVWLFCKLIQKRKFKTLGFYEKDFAKEYAKGLLFGLIAFSAAVMICVLTGSLEFTGLAAGFSISAFFLFVLGYMIQGMAEEVVCRGYFMVSVARRSTIVVGIIANSVMFGALHLFNSGMNPIAFINLVLFGVFASTYFLKRGNIWGVGAFHAIWNLVQGNVYGIKVSGMSSKCSILSSVSVEGRNLINGGDFGLEGGLAVTIVLIVGIIIIYTRKTVDTGRDELTQQENPQVVEQAENA